MAAHEARGPFATRARTAVSRVVVLATCTLMLGLSLTVAPAAPPAAADEPVQVGVNVVNKLDVALAVGPTGVDYSTFETDLRASLKNRPVPVADEDLYITAAKAVSANTTNEFQWWTYDHTIPTNAQQPTRLDTDGNGTAFKSTTYPNYQAFYNYVIAQAKLGTEKSWNTADAPSVSELARYADLEPSSTSFRNVDDSTHQYVENSAMTLRTGTYNPATGYIHSTDKTSPNYGPYATSGTNQTHPYDGNLYHMEESNGGSRMDFYGYGTNGYKDFRYLPNGQKTKKSFEFAIEEMVAYDALDGVGFLFNTDITGSYESGTQTMSGYLLFLAYNTSGVGANIEIYKFQNVNTKSFHQATSTLVSSTAGFTKVASAPYSPTDRYRRIRLDVYPTYVKAYYNGSPSDATVLTTPIVEGATPVSFTSGTVGSQITLDQSYVSSYGFGPMASYRSHSCSRPTAIAMQNISMTMDKVKTLVEVVDEPEWHDGTKKFLVNLNEETIPDFEETNITARLLNRLRNDDIYYIGWATQDNAEKSSDFLEKNDLRGTVVNMTQDDPDPRQVYAPTYAQQIKAIADEIYKQYWVENVGDIVLTTDNVVFTVTGADQTGTADAEYPDGKWRVVHRTSGADPAAPTDPDRSGDDAFRNDKGVQSWSGVTRSDLDVQFDKPGYYDLYYRDQYLKTIMAHRPPVASFDVAIGSGGSVTFANRSYDPDFDDDLTTPCSVFATEVCSQWKYLDLDTDTTPRDGVPTILVEGHTYIVYLTVTDRYGAQTSISRQVRYVDDCGDECVVDPEHAAPFADFTITPTTILPWGSNPQAVTLTNRSYDPQGLTVTSTFTLTHDGTPFAGYSFAPGWEEGVIDVTGWPVGEYAISLVVANGKKDALAADLVSAPYVLTFTIVEDHAAPRASADPVPGSYVGNTTVTLRFSDVGDAGLDTQRVAVTGSAVTPATDDPAWTATSAAAARPVTVSQTGSYIHWEATDRAGNVGTGVFGPYTITKAATTLTLTASPGTTTTFGAGTVTLTATVSPTTPTGSVHFYAGSDYLGSGTISSGIATLVWTPTTAGSITVAAEYGGDGSHSGSTDTLAYTVTKSSSVSLALGEQTDKVYDGDPFEVTGITMTAGGASSTAYTLAYEGTHTDGVAYGPTATAPTEAGDYTVTVTTTDSRYVEKTDSATFSITKASQSTLAVTGLDATYEIDASTPPTATVGTSGGSGSGTVSYAITAQDPAGTATLLGTTVTISTVGTFSVTATKAADRNYTEATATHHVTVVDTTVPTGTITATSSVTPPTPANLSAWTDLYSALLVFDHFSLGTASFTVEDVADNSGEDVTISYLLSDEALSAAEITGPGIVWTAYTAPVVQTSTWKGLMYARLVDSSGNTAYISSSGVVVYTDVTQRTASFSTERYSTTDRKVPLTFNGNTVASVTVTGVPAGAPTPSTASASTVDYTGPTPGIIFAGSFLANLRIGTYTLEVGYNPLGEPFVPSGWNMAPATTTVTVVVTSATPTVTLTAQAETNDALHTEDVTLTASVTGASSGSAPTGTVSFYAVAASEPCGTGPVLSSQAWSGSPLTTVVSSLGATAHTFCAVYSGDANYASAADTASVQINDWITAVAVSPAPTKTVYRYGEPLDIAGGVLGLTWSDGTGVLSVDFEDLSAAAFTGYTPTTLGTQTVTVTYSGHTATFAVTVVDYQVGVVLVDPTKTAYEWGDPLLVAGGSIAQKMASGAVQGQVPLTAAMVSGFTSTQEGRQTLTATNDWGEGAFSGNVTVDVVDPVLEIRVKTPPDKTRYAPGEPLDLTGGEIYVVRKSGTYPMSMTDAMASGYISTQEGSQTIMINHAGKQTSFAVVIVAAPGHPTGSAASGAGGNSTVGDHTGGPGGRANNGGGQTGSDDTASEGPADAVPKPTDDTDVEKVDDIAQLEPDQTVQESDGRWALLNIVLVAAGLVLTICGAVVLRRRKAGDPPGRRRRTVGVTISAVATLVGIVVLLLVLDPSGRAVVVDTWTPLLAATFALSLGGLVWSVPGSRDTAIDPVTE